MDDVILNIDELFREVQKCKDERHFQQVVYSVHRNVCTQICFDCQAVRHTELK